MPPKPEHRVRKAERALRAPEIPDWESARVFLEISRLGSLRAAAKSLDQSVNALRHRIDTFETALGLKLFTRHNDGIRLTQEGDRVLTAARRMEEAAFELVRGRDQANAGLAGEVRIAITEGLGTFWVAPRIRQFQKQHPGISISLDCSMAKADVMRLEADVAIQLEPPRAPDLKVVKLARLHIMPFASPDYVAEFGLPESLDDLKTHGAVILVADQIASMEEYGRISRSGMFKGRVLVRTDASPANYIAIVNGAGMGLLPTYACTLSPALVPLDVGFRTEQDVWLVFHRDVPRVGRVQAVIDWLRESFSSKRQPWFADRFVHPREFSVSGSPNTISPSRPL